MTVERQRFNPLYRLIRRLRNRAVRRFVPQGSRVLDVGCGQENARLRSGVGVWRADSLGIDLALREEFVGAAASRQTVQQVAQDSPAAFDAVVSLAVLEHLDRQDVIPFVESIRSCLRNGGRVFLTTPHRRSKWLLKFMAFRLHVISEEEIRDHKHYFGRDELIELMESAGFTNVDYSVFQLGLNQRIVATRG
jgi:2-polyprenyl-3-methyl-5-hydroxy-6-metoxy-1,4-benzoquinol methylase